MRRRKSVGGKAKRALLNVLLGLSPATFSLMYCFFSTVTGSSRLSDHFGVNKYDKDGLMGGETEIAITSMS